MREETIVAADGCRIAATFHAPASEPKAAVLIVPAMGVSQPYYAPFAAWLAEQGFAAATFDYRGIGASRPKNLRGFKADLFDWARLDCAAMVDAAAARAPGRPLFWIGHSLGAQILPFVPNRGRVAKVVTIAAGSGYWRENAPQIRRSAWLIWHVIAPIALPLFGYFPGRRLGMIGDLPAGVMRQWRRWCLHPEYALAEGEHARELYAAVRTPIVSLSFEDDEMMSARNTESLHGSYVNAPRTMKRIAPADVGAQHIGHFGFFRRGCERSLWRAQLLPELAA